MGGRRRHNQGHSGAGLLSSLLLPIHLLPFLTIVPGGPVAGAAVNNNNNRNGRLHYGVLCLTRSPPVVTVSIIRAGGDFIGDDSSTTTVAPLSFCGVMVTIRSKRRSDYTSLPGPLYRH